MAHTRSALGKLMITTDDILRDNEWESILTLLEDTCGDAHCILFAACDKYCYRQLGAASHESCGNNLKAELSTVTSLFKSPRPDISALR
jgi:uncharacterized protein YcgI (DUF1989 family)